MCSPLAPTCIGRSGEFILFYFVKTLTDNPYYRTLKDTASAKEAELLGKLEESRKRRLELEEQLKESPVNEVTLLKQKHTEEIEQLKKKHKKSMDEQRRNLKKEKESAIQKLILDNTEQDEKIEGLQKLLDERKPDEEMQKRIQELEEENQRLRGLGGDVQMLTMGRNLLSEELRAVKVERSDLRVEVASLRIERDELKADFNTLSNSFHTLNTDLVEVRAQRDAVQAELENVLVMNQVLQQELNGA